MSKTKKKWNVKAMANDLIEFAVSAGWKVAPGGNERSTPLIYALM